MSSKRNFFEAFRTTQRGSKEDCTDANENETAANQPSTSRQGNTNYLEKIMSS